MEEILPPPEPPPVPSPRTDPPAYNAVDASQKGQQPETVGVVRELVLAPPPLNDSWNSSHMDGTDYQLDTLKAGVGQAFTAIGGVLASAKFYLQKVGAPTGNAVAKLYAATGSFPAVLGTGAALATSDPLTITTISTAGGRYELFFTGANRYVLVNGTNYVVAFEATMTGTDKIKLGTNANNNVAPKHYGNLVTHDAGLTWTSDALKDLVFYLYKI